MLLAHLGIDLRPLGLRTPQPWPLHHRAKNRLKKRLAAEPGNGPGPLILSTTTLLPTSWWLLQMACTFLFYLILFFHSGTNLKELAAQLGIDPRPPAFEHHSTTTTPPWLLYFTWSFSFTLEPTYIMVILKGWGPRLGIYSRSLGFLGFEHHSLDHYTTMAKAERLLYFYST